MKLKTSFFKMFLLAAIGAAVTSVAKAQDTTSGLIAWYKFNDGSGTNAADSSGNGNNASLYYFPTDNSQWVPGVVGGGALFFNSDQAQPGQRK